MKWGEYASEVQLILRKSTPESNKNIASSANQRSLHTNRTNGMQNPLADHSLNNSFYDSVKGSPTIGSDFDEIQGSFERNRDIRKSLTFSGLYGNTSDQSPLSSDVSREKKF